MAISLSAGARARPNKSHIRLATDAPPRRPPRALDSVLAHILYRRTGAHFTGICTTRSWQPAMRAEHAGDDRNRRDGERNPVRPACQREGAVFVAARTIAKLLVDAERLEHIDHEREDDPDRDHQVEPPERGIAEAVPGIEPGQHVDPGQAGERDRHARLRRKTPLERLEGG